MLSTFVAVHVGMRLHERQPNWLRSEVCGLQRNVHVLCLGRRLRVSNTEYAGMTSMGFAMERGTLLLLLNIGDDFKIKELRLDDYLAGSSRDCDREVNFIAFLLRLP